ncbi:serine/threonine-protein phosphatase 7 long form homolog [Arachis hypogaea]|uniref:serine/threonine-protein phosphatase 7 long form homolog n=1 Tax=Arachis hypogaea TaxID=3818 RepID=UPI003B22539B
MCPSCSLHAGNAKHVDHLELPKRKLRLAVVRSKTQVAFGRLPCCMNTTCLKRVVMESINQTESKTQKAKARVAGVLIYKVLLNFCELRGHSALLRALVERWRPETHTFHLPVSEVIVTLEDVSYILGLPVDREPVNGRSDSSHQFLVENCITCFGREPGPQDHVLGKLGAASLAHLYRSLYRASRYNCKEKDGPLILLFVCACERMLFLAPIPRDQLVYVGIPLARRWSHWRRHTRYTRWPTEHFRRALDNRGFDDFIWRTYMGVGVPDVLAPYLAICSTHSPLVSFECIEWHPTERVRRQFGMQQLPSGPAFDLGRDHCKRLTGAQNHDWGEIYSEWVNRWRFDCYNTLQLGEEIIDFHPLPVYYEWYT